MTILTACQEAAIELSQSEPTALFSSTGTFERELRLQAKRSAEAIAQAYDWQKLKTLATLTGDGTTLAFDLPSDYDRMLKKAEVHSSQFDDAKFRKANDLDEWLYLNDTGFGAIPGSWIIYGGKMRIFPAIPLGETARFYYVSNKIISDGATTPAYKAAFTADTDTFVLSEKLLALGVVWRWRAMKRKDYAEDMRNYEIALAEEIGKDKGSNILTVGRQRMRSDVTIAYPGVLG